MAKKRVLLSTITFLIITSIYGAFLSVPLKRVNATTYEYFIPFEDYKVTNYNDFQPSFIPTTYNLTNLLAYQLDFDYRVDNCSTVTSYINMTLRIDIDSVTVGTINIPELYCSTNLTHYGIVGTYSLSSSLLQKITLDNGSYANISTRITMQPISTTWYNHYIYMSTFLFDTAIQYDFNETYLISHVLLHTDYNIMVKSSTQLTSGTESNRTYLVYTYDNNNTYIINNTSGTNLTASRYALPYQDEDSQLMVTARGVAVGMANQYDTLTWAIGTSTTARYIYTNTFLYYLNVSNRQYAFPIYEFPSFTYIDPCDIWDMSCGLNNAVTYLLIDAPITSSIYGVVEGAWQLVANGFYFFLNIGDNIIGFLMGLVIALSILIYFFTRVGD